MQQPRFIKARLPRSVYLRINARQATMVCLPGIPKFRKIKVGHQIVLHCDHLWLVVKVLATREYKTVEEMIAQEGYAKIRQRTREEHVMQEIKGYCPDRVVSENGVVVLEIEFVYRYDNPVA